MEQVRTVAVHLDAGARLHLTPGVAADVVPAVDDEHVEATRGGALGDGQSVEPGPDDDQVGPHQTSSRSAARCTRAPLGRGIPADGCRCHGGATGTLSVASIDGATVNVLR